MAIRRVHRTRTMSCMGRQKKSTGFQTIYDVLMIVQDGHVNRLTTSCMQTRITSRWLQSIVIAAGHDPRTIGHSARILSRLPIRGYSLQATYCCALLALFWCAGPGRRPSSVPTSGRYAHRSLSKDRPTSHRAGKNAELHPLGPEKYVALTGGRARRARRPTIERDHHGLGSGTMNKGRYADADTASSSARSPSRRKGNGSATRSVACLSAHSPFGPPHSL